MIYLCVSVPTLPTYFIDFECFESKNYILLIFKLFLILYDI